MSDQYSVFCLCDWLFLAARDEKQAVRYYEKTYDWDDPDGLSPECVSADDAPCYDDIEDAYAGKPPDRTMIEQAGRVLARNPALPVELGVADD